MAEKKKLVSDEIFAWKFREMLVSPSRHDDGGITVSEYGILRNNLIAQYLPSDTTWRSGMPHQTLY